MSSEDNNVPGRDALESMMAGQRTAAVEEASQPVTAQVHTYAEPVPAPSVNEVNTVQPTVAEPVAQPVVEPAPIPQPVAQQVPVAPAAPDHSQTDNVAVSTISKVEPVKNKTRIRRDLSSLKVQPASDATTLAVHNAISMAKRRSKGGTFRAAALKSGYAFEARALDFSAIERLLASASSPLAEQQKLIRTAYQQIEWFSCGQLSYEQFISSTAYSDLDTIYYAIYAATYPGTNSYPIPCEHCGKENTVQVTANQLLSVVDNDALSRVREVLSKSFETHAKMDFMDIEIADRMELDDSQAVVQYGIASISDYLNGIDQVSNAMVDPKTRRPTVGNEEVMSIVQCQLNIDALYLPSSEDGDTYIEITDKYEIASFIKDLSKNDGLILKEELTEIDKKYEVSYGVPSFNCAHCTKRNSDRTLDFERLLFTELARGKND